MGCCCFIFTNNYLEEAIERNIKQINKITNSRKFYERSKIKIKFLLIKKNKIKVTIVINEYLIFFFLSTLFKNIV